MYGPTRGKVGSFGTAEKNVIARELQKELKKKGKSKYDPWQKFGPVQRGSKRGMFRDKNYEIKRRQQREINLKDWTADIKAQYGNQAEIVRQGSNIDVQTGFQKFKYIDDPMGFGDVQLKSVEAFVPEGFTKVQNPDGTFKIVAQAKKYTRRYSKKKGKSSRRDYGTYIPVEAILDKEGNLQKVIKRDDYRTYNYSADGKRKKEYGVMVTEETVFENNRKKMSKFWDDYKKKEKDYSSGKEKRYYGTYLKKTVDYTTGLQTQYNRPDTEYSYKSVKPKVEQPQQSNLKRTTVNGVTYEHTKNTGVYNIGGKTTFVKVGAPGNNDPAGFRVVK